MRYRSKSGKSGRNCGYERAKAHIDEGIAFSDEVGNADAIVKEAFFSLTGRSREYLLKQYGDLHGASAREWAEKTISSWQSGKVKMSGMVAKRLFDLMPPYMGGAQKYKIVEEIWKRYGPSSSKFVYIGKNSDENKIIAEVESYFETLNILHQIPPKLEKQFDWISHNDVTVKQQLLNLFVKEQLKLAMSSVRLNLPMLLTKMRLDTEGKIAKLSHTVFVGNHRLEIKADPLRVGFLISDSANAEFKPKSKVNWGLYIALGIAALIVVSFLSQGSTAKQNVRPVSSATSASDPFASLPAGTNIVDKGSNDTNLPSQPRSSVGSTSNSSTVEPPSASTTATSSIESSRQISALTIRSGDSLGRAVTTGASVPKSAARINSPVVHGGTTRTVVSTAAPLSTTASQVSKTNSGCAQTYVANVEDDGATVKLISGGVFQISSNGMMRVSASQWSTSDPVILCLSPSRYGNTPASIENPSHYVKIQASLIASEAQSSLSCTDTKVAKIGLDGVNVDTIDGYSYRVSQAGMMQVSVSNWSTGDSIKVCKTRLADKTIGASIANPLHYTKVQTYLENEIKPASLQCKSVTVQSVSEGGNSVTVSDGRSYSISASGMMQVSVQQWSTGDKVQVCESSPHKSEISASIENPDHYVKVQAARN